MSTDGILEYQGTKRVLYRGDTSNIVFDTRTTSLGIGVTGSNNPSSNLYITGNAYVSSNLAIGGVMTMGVVNVAARHNLQAVTAIGNVTTQTVQFDNPTTAFTTTGNVSDLNVVSNVNMLHTANTAAIKLNSNVVTEFPRSRKLIKYPRVAMTGQTTSNHTVTGSSWYGSGANYEPWKAFDNVGNHPSGQLAWYSFDHSAPEAYSGSDYAFNPSHGGTATPVLFTGAVQGEWLKIQLPHKVALDHYIMYGPNQEREFPRDWTVYGSSDGTNWNWIDSRIAQIFGDGTGGNGTATGKRKEFYLDTPTNEYLYFGFVFTRGSVNRDTYIGIGEIELFGVPEHDPEAHGTDVTLKSMANVPNTDWLDVYYDGQDYTSMPTTVDNKTGVSTYDATPINGVGFDATQKAFTFNANSSQYLSSSTPISGNYVHTISMWFKGTNLTPTGGDTLMWVGDNTDNKRIEIYIENDRINYNFRTNNCEAHTTFQNNRWYHLTCTYNGQQGSAGREIYVDGQRLSTFHTGNSADLNITNSTLNVGGFSGTTTTYMFSGFIANFRFSNRVLTSDEIYQLYAYQKEEFGHGDLSMTLKAGRLGIGTSEPKAALDINSGGVRLNQELWGGSARRNDTVRVSTNTLSFYEEGSWTPVLGAVATPTYTEQFGYYTRIGNIVHLVFRISVTNLDNGDGSGIHISLPYELANNNGHSAMCSFGYNNSLFDPNRSNGGANIGNGWIIPAQGGSGQTPVAVRYNNCWTSGTLLGFATYSLQVTK